MKRKTFSLDGSGKNLATAKCNFWFPLHEMIEHNKSNEMLNQNFLFWIWQHDPTAKHRLKKASSTAPSCRKWGEKERLIIWDHAGLQHQKWSSCSCLQCSFPSFPDAAISWFFFTSNCWSLSRLVKLWRRIKREATNGTGTRLKQQSQFSMCKFTTRKADVEQCAQSRCNPPPASTKMQPASHSLRQSKSAKAAVYREWQENKKSQHAPMSEGQERTSCWCQVLFPVGNPPSCSKSLKKRQQVSR